MQLKVQEMDVNNDVSMEELHSADEISETDDMRDFMLDKLAKSNAFFKSQQIGEPDLTFQEKRKIASEILYKSPSQFLFRFGKYLTFDDLLYFKTFKEDYAVDFYIKEIQKGLDKQKTSVTIKNRRYEALRRLVRDGEYFSDAEMKKRNPLLYEQMIGQYMTDEEKEEAEKIDQMDLRFTTILLEHIERDQISSLRRQQQEAEDNMFEESDDDDDDESDYDRQRDSSSSTSGLIQLPESERQLLREEFISSMHQNFLKGKDEFDYDTVDDNAEYDNIDELNKDEEEKYFDSEEPELLEHQHNLPDDMNEDSLEDELLSGNQDDSAVNDGVDDNNGISS